jgi:PhoPQ-activated pathogenicity-related protein
VKEKHDQDIERFLVTGGSKRGWTTWLSAVADERVEYIAPLIIDMLNAGPQMQHQLAVYGGFSTQIEDYTQRNLQQRMASAEGQKLNSIVDPYSYREQLTLPKLIVLGANDPYWTVDAANFYYDDLKGPKRLYYQANTGHDVSIQGVATVTEFYNSMLTGAAFPEIQWTKQEDGKLVVTWEKEGGTAKLWQAHSPNRDFRDSRWTSAPVEGEGRVEVAPPAAEEGWIAWYVEVNWTGSVGMPFGLTTQMNVTPDTLPEPGIRAYDQPAAQAALKTE